MILLSLRISDSRARVPLAWTIGQSRAVILPHKLVVSQSSQVLANMVFTLNSIVLRLVEYGMKAGLVKGSGLVFSRDGQASCTQLLVIWLPQATRYLLKRIRTLGTDRF